ncbi:autotransporter-associated beta strand repeat-containing protein [Lysobacter sp.]|uniref:autotransporter-associated beta strand repeat-containing protein n=1 Tax=Lysobacter sp. TaxID=72226 RepID=UPI002D56C6D2|nr:autotransporter-associated beta strand repeat-containing protein [Lysobacter sp.]HZX76841.1 autotransporter-associated beta strand repeat-containing protein [Lysobacter sp.]
MNHVFRVIWSKVLHAWVVTSELATCCGKSGGVDARPAADGALRTEANDRVTSAGAWQLRAAIMLVLATSFAPARAADRHWDINGDGAGVGGSGIWNGSNLFWHGNATGSGGGVFAWDNGALDDAFFGGTAGTVTLGAPVTVHSLNFTANGYTLTGNTLTLAGANPSISTTGGNTATINSVLAGTNGLTVNGTSTNGWIQLGGTNTLTGGITVNSNARLVAAGSNSLNGAANIVTVNSGGALQINTSNAFGGNTAAANLVLNNGANLWLGNTNLTHDITANGGTVVIADVFANGNSTWTGNLVLTANTTLLVNNTGANDNLFFAGNLTDTGSNRLAVVLNEGGDLNSSLHLTGTNSFTGGITVNAGQLFLTGNDSAAAGAGNVVTLNGGILRVAGNAFGGDTDAAQLIINNGGLLRVDSNQTLNHDVTLTGGIATIDGVGSATWNGTPVLTAGTQLRLGVTGNTLTVRGPLQDTGANVLSLATHGGNVRFNNTLGFTGGLALVSGNTWFDGGTYTYTGDTVINSGASLLLNSASLSPNSNIRYQGLNNGNVTVIYGTSAHPSITIPLGAGGAQLRWNGTGGFYALNNQSDVTVNLGGGGATLAWNDGLFVPDGHALILGTNGTGVDARQLDFQNAIDLSGGLRQVRADNGTIADHAVMSGMLTGSGGLQVIGNGLLELRNTGNNYSGATVVGDNATANVGNLLLGSNPALSPNSNLQINGAGIGSLEHHGGYVLLNTASGPFTRALGTGAGQVQWTASGGFGAIGAPQIVDIGGAGATLTWGSGGFVPTGHALRFGGNYANSTIDWRNGIDLGAVDRTINVNEGVGAGWFNGSEVEVALNGVIEGTGGLILRGWGDVALNGLNTYSGTTWLGGVNITDGGNMWVWANTLADTGVASSLGAGSTVSFNSHDGGLIYNGGATSTNRTLALNRTHGANHYLFNYGTGALTWAGDVTTTGSGVNNLRLGARYSTTLDANGVAVAPNVISGVISDGTGVTAIRGWNGTNSSCTTGGIWRLTGANTFTGELFPEGCVFEVATIADAGIASAVGAGDLIADFRSTNGTVRYTGDGDTTDRLFWSWGDAHLESSGTGPLVLTNTGLIVDRNGGFTQWLGGSNTGDNLFAPTLVNGLTTAEFHGSANIFTLAKNGAGLWALTTDNNNNQHAYVGNTRVLAGALRMDHAGAVTGGLGAISSHGTTGSSQRSSLIVFEGAADGTGGVIGLTAASGGFFRGTTTTGRAWQNNNGTTVGVDPDGPTGPLPAYGLEALDDDNYIQGVRWQSSGGFAAWDGTQVVNLFGDAREVTWGTGGFVPTAQHLVFGYTTADGTVDFRNGVNLGSAARTVHVNDGLAQRDAIMSGVLRGTSVLGGLTKAGTGALTLTANNTYTGTTNITAGTLELGNGGTTGSMGTGAQAVVAAGATLVANHSNAFNLSQNIVGDGTLVQRGTGTTSMAQNSDIDHVVLEQGRLVTPGTLLAQDVTFTDQGGATLQVAGAMRTSAGGMVAVTGGAGNDTVRIDPAGNLLADGSLGAGADTLDVSGLLTTSASSFDLADGDDTLAIRDNANITGTVLGGAGIDTLDAIIGTIADLDRAEGFETLAKSGTGVLRVNGAGASDFATVNVNAGTLDVQIGASIVAPTGGTLDATIASSATLNVDGAFGCGDGNDSITIAGNVTGTGTIDQCGGDDTLTLRDGASVSGYTGVLDGGAHTAGIGDTVQLDIAGFIDFAQGTVANYENLIKSNTGTALLSGSHAYTGGTTISGGTLDVDGSLATPTIAMTNATGVTTLNVDGTVEAGGATQTVIAGSSGSNNVNVGAGAILLASGSLGDGTDTLDVAGSLDTGAGSFGLGDGDDVLVIHDFTSIAGASPIDGGAHGAGDTVALNITGSYVFANTQAINFETLRKENTGIAIVTGTQAWQSVQLEAGTLTAAGLLEAPVVTMADGATLAVEGTLQGSGGGYAAITGSAGTNTVNVADGALLRAGGELGDGDDVLDVAGTLDTNGGTFGLGAGDDMFVVHDTTTMLGAVDGGLGNDMLNVNVSTGNVVPLGSLLGFESLGKSGDGTLQINGPSSFIDVGVVGGLLEVGAGGSVSAQNTTIGPGAMLQIDGSYTGTAGSDTLVVAGTVGGSGTVNLGDGSDSFTLQDGADLSGLATPVDGGAGVDGFIADLAGNATLGGIVNFETLTKRNTGTLHIDGPAPSSFSAVQLDGGVLDIGAGGSVAAIPGGTLSTTIAAGTTLNVDGSYGCGDGNDTFDVAGTVSGTGTIDLCGGEDMLTLADGAVLTATISGGTHGAGDTVVLNNSGALGFDAGNTINFEFLRKENSGEATLVGASNFSGGTTVNDGTLTIAGTLATPTVALADGTVLNVGGTLLGNAGGFAAISGSAGANTVNVAAGALLQASGDLGEGSDVLDVVGVLDTGAGTFALGDGDDSFVVHDGTVVIGTVDGGAGLDTRVYDINGTADLGALVNFEGVTKTGAGILNINGPATTELQSVEVLGGTLNIGAGGSVAAASATALVAAVGTGATLNVEGSFGCGDGNDSLSVSGTVSGAGTIDLCGGEDTLTLSDGALLMATISGGGHGSGDTIVLDNAGAFSFDAGNVVNFEMLQKDNTGEATLTGTQSFTGGTILNDGTLTVAGTLQTPTLALADDTVLNVAGLVQGDAGGHATIGGSSGTNTVNVADGALLRALGDLGDGNDVLDVAGTLDTNGGTFTLGAGDDMFVVHDTTTMLGAVDGGLGNDMLNVNVGGGNLVPLGSLLGFESLGKSGDGTLQVNGASSFIEVDVMGGTLQVGPGGAMAARTTTIASGATLQVDGAYTGTAGDDTMSVAGRVVGVGTVDLAMGDDSFILQDGADLSWLVAPIDGGAGTDSFVADLVGTATLGGAINFETLTKSNTGTLNVDGPAASSFATVNVDSGTLNVGVAGSLSGAKHTTVAMGSVLNVDGSYAGSSGDDLMEVAGVLTGHGTIALADGDDRLILMEGADLGGLGNALDGGAGTDIVSAQVGTTMTLGPTVNFETLNKSGGGSLFVEGVQSYRTAQIEQGTLAVVQGATLISQDTTVNTGATLDVQGAFTGTSGDDSFVSMGTVKGALAFGGGDDHAHFVGADLSGLTGIDGGDGAADVLRFSALDLDGGRLGVVGGWERVELSNGTELTSGGAIDLGTGVLAIDSTSSWFVNPGTRLAGHVENAGLIAIGAHRLAISGNYAGDNGVIEVAISPEGRSVGGLDIGGDVTGTTTVVFNTDGTEAPSGPASILVVSSPNDNAATSSSFTAHGASDGTVRLDGSIHPWTFARQGDQNWYLSSAADGLLPEISGYAVLPSIGRTLGEQGAHLVHDRMSGIRDDGAPACGQPQENAPRADSSLVDDCHGFWLAATAGELEMDADPGFEFSGDSVGLYAGVDAMLRDTGARTFRGGLFLGYQHGNYWTTGANSTDLPGMGQSNVRVEASTGGMYASTTWSSGAYVDLSLIGQVSRADVRADDGFSQTITGNGLTLNARVGHSYRVASGWVLEPQLQLGAIASNWGDMVDTSGKPLAIDDDTFGIARAALRMEKTYMTAKGGSVRPWATLGVQNTFGESDDALEIGLPGPAGAQAFPAHDVGTAATVDLGMEARLGEGISLFGVGSYGRSVSGSGQEQRAVNLGVRVRW